MSNFRHYGRNRIIALLLAITLIIGMLQLGLFSVFAVNGDPHAFTFNVKNGLDVAIEGATVAVNGMVPQTTDVDGKATFSALSEGTQYNYSVTMSGFITVNSIITIGSDNNGQEIVILKTPPVVGNITTPDAITSGGILVLTLPTIVDENSVITIEGWEISENKSVWEAYNDTALDCSYDGYYLRYMTKSVDGTLYCSNTVQITVNKITTALSLNANPKPGTHNEQIVLTATLSPVLVGKEIIFNYGGSDVTGMTNTEGVATVNFTADASTTYTSISASFAGDDNHKSVTSAITDFSVKKADQTIALTETGTIERIYSNDTYINAITSQTGDGELSYNSSLTTVANIDTHGLVTIVGVGETTITITKAQNINYNQVQVTYIFKVTPKELTIEPGTAIATPRAYNKTNSVEITGGTLTGIINNDSVALVNSGHILDDVIVGERDVITGYTLSGDDKENYTLTQPTEITCIISQKKLTVSVTIINKNYNGKKDAQIQTATLVGSEIGDNINLINGTPTFDSENVGTQNVSFTGFSIIGNDSANYFITQPTGITGEIVNNFIPFKNTEYEINPAAPNLKGWYKDNIEYIAKTGYLISRTNTANGDWTNTLTEFIDINGGSIAFYIKDVITDEISEQVTENYNLDKTAPTNMQIKYSTNFFRTFINTISLGLFFNNTITVEVKATDVTSGIEMISWSAKGTKGKNLGAANNQGGTVSATKIGATDEYIISFVVNKEFYGQIEAVATDFAGNSTTDKDDYITIDSEKPVVSISFDNNNSSNVNYYKADRKATITIVENNFDESAVVITAHKDGFLMSVIKSFVSNENTHTMDISYTSDADYDLKVEYIDNSGNVATVAQTEFTIDKTAPIVEVTYDNNTSRNTNYYKAVRTATIKITEHNFKANEVNFALTAKDILGNVVLLPVPSDFDSVGDVHTATISYIADAEYSFDIAYTDLAGNTMSDFVEQTFIIDADVNNAKPYNLTIGYNISIVDIVLNAITFGFYNEKVKVMITADDDTSGLEKIDWTASLEVGSSPTNTSQNGTLTNFTRSGKTQSTTFDINPEFRGFVSITATDLAGNEQTKADTKVIVIDTIAPGVTVGYDNQSAINTNYYKADRKATITIEEANFFDSDVVILAEKRLNSEAIYSAMPKPTFAKNGDIYIATIDFNENADYRFDISYTDKSGNLYDDYTIDEFTVDKTTPTVEVTYDNNTSRNTNYYKEVRTATIVLTEHNFNASEVNIILTAKDILANAVLLPVPSDFDSVGDVHTATINYIADAEYSFDIAYTDLAGNTMSDFVEQTFIIDADVNNAKPYNLTIGYNISIVDIVLNAITFGFYKEKVTVTITADDDTSGLEKIDWKAIGEKGKDDSTNATTDGTLTTFTRSGKTQSTTFEINPEFRGLVSITATDLAGNAQTKADTKVIVVDDIPSTATISYEPKPPSQTIGDTDFYNGDITVKIKIIEANFYAEDINVDVVTKDIDGTVIDLIDVDAIKAHFKLDSSWIHSGTLHEATLTLSEEAYYTITVNYTDKSTNEMNQCTSRRMCLDKTTPDNLEIQYNSNPFRAFLNVITFNLFEIKVDVTIKAKDVTAGVQYIEWQYIGVSGTDNTTPVNVISTIDQKAATRVAGTNDYIISFMISEQFKGDIKATAVDFATNRSDEDPAIDAIEIVDTKNPIIVVTYPNDVEPLNGKYYKANRTAKVEITEDNFVESKTKIIITKDGQPYSTIIPTNWTSVENIHSKTFTFNEDGDYSFKVTCEDVVGRKSELTEKEFTLDKIIPTIAVAYDNNSALNTYYYKANRTATITIVEHNFKASEVVITQTATLDGNNIALPTVNGWTTSGDTHTATINYTANGKFTLVIAYADLAGNNAAKFLEQTFHVDKTVPTLDITNIVNNSANKGDVSPLVSYSDVNFDVSKVVITLTGANKGKVTPTGNKTDVKNGQTFKFENFPKEKSQDDIYTLTATLTDMAGNKTTQTVRFSVNRFGSTYELQADTKAIMGKYVKKEINIVIDEINIDRLKTYTLKYSRDGVVVNLVEGDDKDYTVKDTGGDGVWSKYTYTINAANFEKEGNYVVTLYSEDDANNTSDNKVKESEIKFSIDKTAPNCTVSGLEKDKSYSIDKQPVTLSVKDNLNLSGIKVYLKKGANGEFVDIQSYNSETIQQAGGEFDFDIEKFGDYQFLKVISTDAAGNETITEINNFRINDNFIILFYLNKPLFYGSIGGLLLIIFGLAAFFMFRKKKES